MISNYFRLFIFHIFLCFILAKKGVKILQLSESSAKLCNSESCSSSQKFQLQNVIHFINQHRPNIILWFSKFRTNMTVFDEFNESVVLPVHGQHDYICRNHSMMSKACYYIHYDQRFNINFIVLSTAMWLNEVNMNASLRQIEWLKQTLMAFKIRQKKVIIVGYDIPGSLETSSGTTKYSTSFNNVFVELLQNYSSTISECIFGGDSIDSFRIVFNSEGSPIVPLFIFPIIDTSSVSLFPTIRIYNFNLEKFMLDNYEQFHCNSTSKFRYNISYNLENIHVKQLFEFTEGFQNIINRFQRYHQYQLRNISFSEYCHNNNISCLMCCSRCFILNLIESNIKYCLKQCMSTKTAKNNNIFYIIGVIIGFVVILLGIVLAVNKTYCIHRNRQRNVFLAPLTLDIHMDVNEDVFRVNGKLPLSKEIVVINPTETMNGYKGYNCEIEQTYDYIRM